MEQHGGQEVSDEHLAAAVARGDHDAFTVLYRRYAPVARRSAQRAARRHPQLDVDEVTNLALTRLWSVIGTFDDAREFAPWAAVVIAHAVRSAATATRSLKSTWNWSAMLGPVGGNETPAAAPVLDAVPGADAAGLETVLLDEQEQTIAALLTEILSTREAEVVKLRLAGWTYAEIADRLRIDAKAVDNAMQRSLSKLRRSFSDGEVTSIP